MDVKGFLLPVPPVQCGDGNEEEGRILLLQPPCQQTLTPVYRTVSCVVSDDVVLFVVVLPTSVKFYRHVCRVNDHGNTADDGYYGSYAKKHLVFFKLFFKMFV